MGDERKSIDEGGGWVRSRQKPKDNRQCGIPLRTGNRKRLLTMTGAHRSHGQVRIHRNMMLVAAAAAVEAVRLEAEQRRKGPLRRSSKTSYLRHGWRSIESESGSYEDSGFADPEWIGGGGAVAVDDAVGRQVQGAIARSSLRPSYPPSSRPRWLGTCFGRRSGERWSVAREWPKGAVGRDPLCPWLEWLGRGVPLLETSHPSSTSSTVGPERMIDRFFISQHVTTSGENWLISISPEGRPSRRPPG